MWLARTVVAGIILGTTTVAWCGPELDPAKELTDATTEVTYLSFERALPLYTNVAKHVAPGSEQWQEAVFGQGMCEQQYVPCSAEHIDKAERYFKQLLEKSPNSRFALRAMMNLGRMAELVDYQGDTADREKAREWYTKVVVAGKDTPIEGEAILRIAGTYIQSYQKDQLATGLALLDGYLKGHPDDKLATAMWQYMGETYFYPLEDYRKSLDCYKKADALGLLEEGREGPVYWRMAILADRYLNDRGTAVEYYKKIITKTPTSGKAYEAQLALKKMGIEPPKIELFDIVASQGRTDAATTQPAKTQEAAQ
jgi:tetratricopeptide (TPR) repeat protein